MWWEILIYMAFAAGIFIFLQLSTTKYHRYLHLNIWARIAISLVIPLIFVVLFMFLMTIFMIFALVFLIIFISVVLGKK